MRDTTWDEWPYSWDDSTVETLLRQEIKNFVVSPKGMIAFKF